MAAVPSERLRLPAQEAAPRLLGSLLLSEVEGRRTVGRIVEVEAYVGPHDPASHAAERIGRTPRNESMFGPAGTAYVYRSYGVHWCFNVVTGEVGHPSAVLVRALEPLEGLEVMAARRGRPSHLCSGPGRLCQALGISGSLDGHRLAEPPLRLLEGGLRDGEVIATSPRIGISRATDWPLRFFISPSPYLSRRPPRP